MASYGPLEPVNLPYWPTCSQALSWSEQDLAVAAGEVVHILTPRDAWSRQEEPGQKQWHKFTLRVNQFEQAEWPFQDLTNIMHFSLGEELSDSTIVSLAWSPPGLGIHRRSVLAVLTSNLVLSFWETDGRLDMWKRTCIVNHHLPVPKNPQHTSRVRRRKRIRAFCWLSPVVSSASFSWAPIFLVVADDTGTISILRVWKSKPGVYGHWVLKLVVQHTISTVESQSPLSTVQPSLRSIISRSCPVSRLEILNASACGDHPSGGMLLQVSRYHDDSPQALAVQYEGTIQSDTIDHLGGDKFRFTITEAQTDVELPHSVHPSERTFDTAIQKLRSKFDEEYNLGGRIRIRYHGTSYSADKTQAAACVSLHPADMIEYGIPSTQHTTVVFAQVNEPTGGGKIAKDASAVYEEILQYVASTAPMWIKKPLDWNIAKNAIALVFERFQDSKVLRAWACSTTKLVSASISSDDATKEGSAALLTPGEDAMDLDKEREGFTASGHENAVAQMDPESCEICGAPIPFSVPPTPARCKKGHQFSRCNISFVAIQEPGISKYCAKCGRQFLDVGKLTLGNGPSLSQALFDKFDVCPYCQGKFRG